VNLLAWLADVVFQCGPTVALMNVDQQEQKNKDGEEAEVLSSDGRGVEYNFIRV
jgi:hypothetical protein